MSKVDYLINYLLSERNDLGRIQVIFNVFKEDDHEIYKKLLGRD